MDNIINPTKEKNRLYWLDAIRGFAIFGIFIVNISAFSAPYFLYGGESTVWSEPIDRFVLVIIDIFFQASFYTLFSILFGFGIQMMKERLEQKNLYAYPTLIRRVLIIAFVGLIHAFLIWNGDILFFYGVVGLLLLLFIKMKKTTILGISAFLLTGTVWMVTFLYYFVRDYLGEVNWSLVEQALLNYQSNSLAVIFTQNAHDWIYKNSGLNFIILVLILLSLFLFGVYVAKTRWLHNPSEHSSSIRKVWIVSLVLFIGVKMLPYLFTDSLWLTFAQDNIGGTFAAIFYISTITLIAQKKIGIKLIKPFIAVGRMALTNYILQSILSIFLFYEIGLGLYGTIGPLGGIVIVLVIFTLQIIGSNWWIQHFYFGPLEWVVRVLTYKKYQPLLRKSQNRL
jgi:uncharacterized protein